MFQYKEIDEIFLYKNLQMTKYLVNILFSQIKKENIQPDVILLLL